MADITLSPDAATAVITEAQKDKVGEGPVYPGTMPEDPDKRVTVATELVGFAIDAYVHDNMRGVEVTDILAAAHVSIGDDGTVSQNGGSPPEPAESPKAREENPTAAADTDAAPDLINVRLIGPDGSAVEVPESAAAALEAAGFKREEPEPDPEPEPPESLVVEIGGQKVELPYEQAQALLASGAAKALPEASPKPEPAPQDSSDGIQPPDEGADSDDPYAGQELEEPWEGYDSSKDTEIRAKMQDFTDEEIAYVKAYEARHKGRQRIANFKPDPKKRKAAEEQRSSATDTSGAEAHSPGSDSLGSDPQELDAAREAEERAQRDTVGEGGVSHRNEQVQESNHDEHVPILTAHDERRLALAEVEKARLPVPPESVEDPPDFPEDIAGLDDGTLWTLHSKFNACLAQANWRLGLVQVDELAFKHIADRHAREVRKQLEPTNPATGKPKGQEALDREAEQREEVQVWRDKQYQAELRAVPLKKLVGIYASYVEVLSRQWTFREKERDSSGGLTSRS